MSNFERLTYIGDRETCMKVWERRHYVFKYGRSVGVPQDFADVLLATPHFMRESEAGKTLEENFPEDSRILLKRWGAMGDLIIFRAALAAYVRTSDVKYEFIIRLQTRFAHIFGHDTLFDSIMPIGTPSSKETYDGVASFDQVAEEDHRGSLKHRGALFLERMTKRSIKIIAEDWKIPLPDGAKSWVARHLRERGIHPEQREKKLVAIQVRGSMAAKTLPNDVMYMVIGRLLSDGHDVILIEPEHNVAQKYMVDDDVHSMTDRDVLHNMAMLEMVDLAITMDSGALWMAHVAGCPTLVILGPTRPEQRITFHPLYPDRARAVCLNEIIDCKACFESGEACKKEWTCMRGQPDWGVVMDMISREATSILSGEKAPISLPVASNST